MSNRININSTDWIEKDVQEVFRRNIQGMILSAEEGDEMYAGDWMYMFSNKYGDVFKNIITRNYRYPEVV